jgi:hypothetical protein
MEWLPILSTQGNAWSLGGRISIRIFSDWTPFSFLVRAKIRGNAHQLENDFSAHPIAIAGSIVPRVQRAASSSSTATKKPSIRRIKIAPARRVLPTVPPGRWGNGSILRSNSECSPEKNRKIPSRNNQSN